MHAAYAPLRSFDAVLERATKRARALLPPTSADASTNASTDASAAPACGAAAAAKHTRTRLINLRQGILCAADDRTARTVAREVVEGIIAQGG